MHQDPFLLDLYACATQPLRWGAVLDRLCASTGACSAVMQAFRFQGDSAALCWQAMDRRTAAQQRMPQARLVATQNPRLNRERSLRGLNRVVRDDELFERDDPDRIALRHRLASLGFGRFLGTLQRLDGEVYLGIALHRAIDDPCDFDRGAASQLADLAPHLSQVCEIGRHVQRSEHSLQTFQAHLDQLRCGLVLCDERAGVRWLNRSAQGQLASQSSLSVRGGVLRASERSVQTALMREIALADDRPRFLSVGKGHDALHLALRRATCTHAGFDEQPNVLLAMTRTADALAIPASAWMRLLDVTATEAGLVAALLEGATLNEHAERRGVSAGTVRQQLKQILAKTGTHRQADLVRLALTSAAAHMLEAVPVGL